MVLTYTNAELDSFSLAELRDIVKKNGWDASNGDGSVPLSGEHISCQPLSLSRFCLSCAPGAFKAPSHLNTCRTRRQGSDNGSHLPRPEDQVCSYFSRGARTEPPL
jgi:hypothetical protein